MKYFALLVTAFVVFSTSAIAREKAPSHATREAAIQLLSREGIINGKTRVVSAEWNDDARWWLVTLRHPSGTLSSWAVDAAAKDYHYVCKH
jgi:hypothetical protein